MRQQMLKAGHTESEVFSSLQSPQRKEVSNHRLHSSENTNQLQSYASLSDSNSQHAKILQNLSKKEREATCYSASLSYHFVDLYFIDAYELRRY